MPYTSTTTRAMASTAGGAQTYARRRRSAAYKHDGTELSVMDWFCADTKTEILTSHGWRRYDQVQVGDLVASLNTEDGIARWVPVQRMNVFQVTDAKMLRVEGKALSALVTEGHRWPVQQRGGKAGTKRTTWQVRTSDQLTLESSVVRSAPFEAPTDSDHDDALVELVGWAWTEGSYRENGGLHLSQSPSVNPAKCERIERALTALYGPPIGRSGRQRGVPAWNVGEYEGTRYWRLNVAAAAPIIAAAPDRVLDPAWLLTLTASQLDLLIEASMLADGTTRVRDGSRDSSLSQNRRDRAEGFQIAAILAGRTTSLNRWEIQHKGEAYPMWRVSLLERVTAKPLRQAVAEWTTHTGTVWCPTVEYGTWLCRRNGLVHWTGNCGAGGSTQGADAVPNVRVTRAANHWKRAIESHERNFPGVAHYIGDIRKAPVWAWPIADIHWGSPECTKWSIAQGKKRSFAKAVQGDLLDLYAEMEAEKFQTEDERDNGPTEEEEASRALMEEIPLYLRGVIERGGLVKAGVVENVVDVRQWAEWDRWIQEFHKMGYRTKLIALNSMHADPRSVHRAPQSRDRLYLVYWHQSLGRTPNFEKWLAPSAFCTGCGETVKARQVFRRAGVDMGRYKSQYDYRCPNTKCGHQIVEPETIPAAAAIDWSIAGGRIGDRKTPLADKTMRRIQAGLDKFARPMMVPTGGTWRDAATDLLDPMPTRTTRENDALAVPPLLVPCDGREGKNARSIYGPMQTQTARAEAGLAWLPFITEIRGGSSDVRAITDPLATVCASGNHHGLAAVPMPGMMMRNNGSTGNGGEHCTDLAEPMRTLTTTGHQSLVTWEPFLAPYYGNGTPRPVSDPVGAISTRDRFALIQGEVNIEDVLFRMLQPHEIQRAMAFASDYVVLGSKRDRVRQLGNAVTPPAAEVLICLLAECITGEEISRYDLAA